MAAVKKVLSADSKLAILAALNTAFAEAVSEFEEGLADKAAEWDRELARKKEEDSYQFNKTVRDREDDLDRRLADRVLVVSEREAIVTEREIAVRSNEREYEQLQQQVAEIPASIEMAVQRGYEKGGATAERDYQTELRIIKSEYEADKKIQENNIAALNTTINAMQSTITTLQTELASANSRVQEVAKEAFAAAGQSKVTVQNTTGK